MNYVDLLGLSRDSDQTTGNLSDVKKEIIQYLIPETSINRQGTKITKVKAIVIHWTEAPNQKPTATIDYWSSDVRVGSAHFVIGTDGSIYQAIPTDERARHAGNTSGEYREKATELFGEGINPNAYSIGIEMEPIDANGKFNQATIDSAIQLTSDLCKEFGLDPQKEVIRHYDVTGKNCPKYYVDNENEWNNFIEQVTNQTNGSKK